MSERKKLKPEEKVKIVRKYLAGEVSISRAAAEAGVDYETLRGWVMQYEAEGGAVFLPGRRNHTYSPEVKLQAVQEYLSGKGSLAELSKKYGLRDRKQLRNWLKVYNPIELACELLHVSRSAYHKWASGKLSKRAAENERLAEKLEKLHAESPDKDYRRLNDDLRHDHGIHHVNDMRGSASAGSKISAPRSSIAAIAAPDTQKIHSILLKIFWAGSFMPQDPTRSGSLM